MAGNAPKLIEKHVMLKEFCWRALQKLSQETYFNKTWNWRNFPSPEIILGGINSGSHKALCYHPLVTHSSLFTLASVCPTALPKLTAIFLCADFIYWNQNKFILPIEKNPTALFRFTLWELWLFIVLVQCERKFTNAVAASLLLFTSSYIFLSSLYSPSSRWW